MTRERWESLLDRLRERYPGLTASRESLAPGPGTVDRVIVETPVGRVRLELTERPRLLTERGRGSHRIGSSVLIERRYDETATVLTLKVWRQGSDGAWTELDPQAIP